MKSDRENKESIPRGSDSEQREKYSGSSREKDSSSDQPVSPRVGWAGDPSGSMERDRKETEH